jgi:Flp pilus assembly protein TadD
VSSDPEIHELRRRAESLARSEEWGEIAIEINTQMLEIDDHDAGAYTRLARCFLEQGKLEAAREMYTQVLIFDPNNSIACNRLPEIEKEIGRAGELSDVPSIGSFAEALALGVAARKCKRYAQAIAALSRAVKLRPRSVRAWNALGAAYRHKRDLAQARSAYNHAMSLRRNAASLIGLAAIARDLRDFDEAIDLYMEVLQGDPNHAYALNGLGGVFADIGPWDKAEELFKRASELAVGRASAMRGLERLRQSYEGQGNNEAVGRISRWLTQLGEHTPRQDILYNSAE